MNQVGDRYRLETAVGVIDVWVMRRHRDGSVDILCTCCGARWEDHEYSSRGYRDDAGLPVREQIHRTAEKQVPPISAACR